MNIPGSSEAILRLYGAYSVEALAGNKLPAYDPQLPWVPSDPDLNSEEWKRAVKVRQSQGHHLIWGREYLQPRGGKGNHGAPGRFGSVRRWSARRPGGEVPKAFVALRPNAEVVAEVIIAFTRERIAHFKCPKYVEFGELPETATGKIQKFVLREKEWAGREKRIQGSQV